MEKKRPHSIVVSRGGRAPTLAPLLRAPMSECDHKMHNVFGNYSSLNYIKIHSRMHPIEPFIKNFLGRAYL